MDDIVDYLVELLNIKNDDYKDGRIKHNLQDLNNHDLGKFIPFCESNINHINLNFQTGYQKLLTLLDMYKSYITNKDDVKIERYATKLYHKTVAFMSELDYQLQINAFEIESDDVTLEIREFFSDKDLLVLSRIGKRERLLGLYRHSRNELKQSIEVEVRKLNQQSKKSLEHKEKSAIALLEEKRKGVTSE